MTKKEFSQGIAMLGSCGCPVQELDKDTLRFWFEILGQFEFIDFRKAVVELSKSKTTWFPNDNIPAILGECTREFRSARLAKDKGGEWQRTLEGYKQQQKIEGPPEFLKLAESIGGKLPYEAKARSMKTVKQMARSAWA